ncbi:hypothetical protein DL96DRAFT_952737 [Flagelloscypha sp. PMI_526]|nr:hypothetical protein DL96DRAFT_952737 [Flagelloscypha sp. PMI_526]
MPLSSDISIRQVSSLSEEEMEQAVEALDASFHRNFFGPELGDNRDTIRLALQAHILAGFYSGEVYIAEQNTNDSKLVVGASVWFGPGAKCFSAESDPGLWDASRWTEVQQTIPVKCSDWWKVFYVAYDAFCDGILGAGQKRANYHLQLLAVHPEHQRKGIARALLEPVEAKARESKKLCLVETRTPLNAEKVYPSYGYAIEGTPIVLPEFVEGTSTPFFLLVKGREWI